MEFVESIECRDEDNVDIAVGRTKEAETGDGTTLATANVEDLKEN